MTKAQPLISRPLQKKEKCTWNSNPTVKSSPQGVAVPDPRVAEAPPHPLPQVVLCAQQEAGVPSKALKSRHEDIWVNG